MECANAVLAHFRHTRNEAVNIDLNLRRVYLFLTTCQLPNGFHRILCWIVLQKFVDTFQVLIKFDYSNYILRGK